MDAINIVNTIFPQVQSIIDNMKVNDHLTVKEIVQRVVQSTGLDMQDVKPSVELYLRHSNEGVVRPGCNGGYVKGASRKVRLDKAGKTRARKPKDKGAEITSQPEVNDLDDFSL